MLDNYKSSIVNGVPLNILDMGTIAERIRQAREAAGIKSQAELARRCGVSRSAVNQWESGESDNIKPANLAAIADACQVEMRWLATGKGAKDGTSLADRQLLDAIQSLPAHEARALWGFLSARGEHEPPEGDSDNGR